MSTLEAPFDISSTAVRSNVALPAENTRSKAAKTIRIFLAGDQLLVRDSLRSLLRQHAGFKVVGESSLGDDLAQLTSRCQPDVMLLDVGSAVGRPMKAVTNVQNAGLGVRTIVLAGEIAEADMLRFMGSGAMGFVPKSSPATLLLKAIRNVSDGQYWIARENLAVLIQAATVDGRKHPAANNQYGLTRRETEIILAVLDGYSNPDIAEQLGLSEQTVKHHLTHIFDKLGVFSRLELALFAVSHHLVDEAQEKSRTVSQHSPVRLQALMKT